MYTYRNKCTKLNPQGTFPLRIFLSFFGAVFCSDCLLYIAYNRTDRQTNHTAGQNGIPETISTTRLNARKSIFTACGVVLYTHATKTPLKAFYGLVIA